MKKRLIILVFISCILGVIFLAIYRQNITDEDIVMVLEQVANSVNSQDITYYKNSDSCKKIAYTKSSEQFLFAEPRSTACGSASQYEPFTEEAAQIFNSVTRTHVIENEDIEILEIKRIILESQLVFSVLTGLNHKSSYMYDPKQVISNDEKYKKINDTWYLIEYNPSPF